MWSGVSRDTAKFLCLTSVTFGSLFPLFSKGRVVQWGRLFENELLSNILFVEGEKR